MNYLCVVKSGKKNLKKGTHDLREFVLEQADGAWNKTIVVVCFISSRGLDWDLDGVSLRL